METLYSLIIHDPIVTMAFAIAIFLIVVFAISTVFLTDATPYNDARTAGNGESHDEHTARQS